MKRKALFKFRLTFSNDTDIVLDAYSKEDAIVKAYKHFKKLTGKDLSQLPSLISVVFYQ